MPYDEDLAERVREALAAQKNVHERAMFGGLAFLVNRNMAVAASSHGGLMVRAEPSEVQSLLEQPHTETIRMRGRAMTGWLRVLSEGVRTDAELDRWMKIGVANARSLPPK